MTKSPEFEKITADTIKSIKGRTFRSRPSRIGGILINPSSSRSKPI
jgi:hypothetical protein